MVQGLLNQEKNSQLWYHVHPSINQQHFSKPNKKTGTRALFPSAWIHVFKSSIFTCFISVSNTDYWQQTSATCKPWAWERKQTRGPNCEILTLSTVFNCKVFVLREKIRKKNLQVHLETRYIILIEVTTKPREKGKVKRRQQKGIECVQNCLLPSKPSCWFVSRRFHTPHFQPQLLHTGQEHICR